MIGSLWAITRVVKNIKKVLEQSSLCIEYIQALEFSRNTRLTSITQGRRRTGGKLMPSNSPLRIKIPSKPLGYDASQIAHGRVYRASYRRFARSTRTCQASHMLYRFDSFIPVVPRCCRMPGRRQYYGVIRKRDARRHYRHRIDRVLSRSAYVLASSGVRSCLLHLGIHDFRCERESSSLRATEHDGMSRARELGFKLIYDCVIWGPWKEDRKKREEERYSSKRIRRRNTKIDARSTLERLFPMRE